MVSNKPYCLWASFIIQNLNIQGNQSKLSFLTSWLRQQSGYPARYNYPGGGPNEQKYIRRPQVSRNWDWAILTHGNGRCDCYTNFVVWSKIEKCKHLLPAARFGTSGGFRPRVRRPEKTNPPPGADFTISPSGFECLKESSHVPSTEEWTAPCPNSVLIRIKKPNAV